MNKTILELNSITFRYDEKTFYFQNKCKNNVNDDKEMAAILDDVSLAVCQSEIYGLLGASGCGKTTLLRLILGQLSPSSGSIQVFGQEIDPNEQSPSHLCNIGYMPQDIVLYNEFSTFEMLQYFGRLYRMPNNECMKRIDQLLKLLELDVGTGGDVGHHHDCSHRNQLIKHLSGGQRRRVSLAIALLHDPRLLILDEPTVGVDPLLRESIWKHLKYLTSVKRRTVLLTTHYIEETRHANQIGFLRRGRLLVQDHPRRLLRRFRVDTMEAAFLKLCHYHDDQQQLLISRSPSIISSNVVVDNGDDDDDDKKVAKKSQSIVNFIEIIGPPLDDQEKNHNLIMTTVSFSVYYFYTYIIGFEQLQQQKIFDFSISSNFFQIENSHKGEPHIILANIISSFSQLQ